MLNLELKSEASVATLQLDARRIPESISVVTVKGEMRISSCLICLTQTFAGWDLNLLIEAISGFLSGDSDELAYSSEDGQFTLSALRKDHLELEARLTMTQSIALVSDGWRLGAELYGFSIVESDLVALRDYLSQFLIENGIHTGVEPT